MKYTNSPLVSYVKLSPNHSGLRKHDIDTITIHCVVGQCTVETLGQIFLPVKRQASCNYGIGYDGRIGLYVDEKNRSWCSSSAANDNRAITIEVASDKTHPYAITPEAYKSLVSLCADICKRNNIKKLVWSTDKNIRVNHLNGCNMTVHRDYANKACPGEYLYNRMGQIASEVNKLLEEYDKVSEIRDNSKVSSYAAESWKKLKDKGATDGSNPKSPCTREQLAVILDRLGLLG